MQEFISQKLIVSIEKYPLHSSLNPKILKEIEDIPFNMSYETNVKAQMTDWSISTPSIEVIKKLVCDVLLRDFSFLREYRLSVADCWVASYNKGEFTKFHDHRTYLYSFVYFVKCPPGSTPLLFTGSTFQQMKAEEGKVVIFPGCMYHYVPKNKSDDRVVMSGNLQFLHSGGISELLGSVNQENKPQE